MNSDIRRFPDGYMDIDCTKGKSLVHCDPRLNDLSKLTDETHLRQLSGDVRRKK